MLEDLAGPHGPAEGRTVESKRLGPGALGLRGPVPALWSLGDLTPRLPWQHRLNFTEPHYSLPLPGLGLTGSFAFWLLVCHPDSPLWRCIPQLLSTAWDQSQSLLALDTSFRLDICFLTSPCLVWTQRQALLFLPSLEIGDTRILRMARD